MHYLENTKHCSVLDEDTNFCYECETYFQLSQDKKECVRSTCRYFDEEGNCKCEEGFYKNDKGGCSKIPIKKCYVGNKETCTECAYGYIPNEEGKECILKDGIDLSEDYEKIDIPHCFEVDDDDKTICEWCEYFYEWDSKSKSCVYLCEPASGTEELCDECLDGYHSYDYGKTCEKIDPEYEGEDDEIIEPENTVTSIDKAKVGDNKGSDNYSKFINLEFAVLNLLIFFIM